MDNIPVGETIRRGYGFAVGNFAMLLGIVWLPLVLVVATGAIFGLLSPAFAPALIGNNGAALKHAWPLMVVFYLFAFLFFSVAIVGLTECALAEVPVRRFFYFSLDGRVWRLFKAYLLSILIVLAVVVVVLVGLVLFGVILAKVSGVSPDQMKNSPMVGLMAGLVPLLLTLWLFYFIVRQMTLLAPVVVAEETGGMRKAWTLSRGQFWRLLAIMLATGLPAVLVWLLVQYRFIFDGLPPSAANGATPQELVQWGANGLARMKQYAFVLAPGFLLLTTFSYGAIYGALAYAYRATIEKSPAA